MSGQSGRNSRSKVALATRRLKPSHRLRDARLAIGALKVGRDPRRCVYDVERPISLTGSTQHVQPLDGRGSMDLASHFYFFLPSAKVGCHPAAFWLGAAAMTLIFFFLGFLASRLLLC